MRRVRYVPAEAAHASSIAPRLRTADRDEIHAVSGQDPEAALLNGIRMSAKAITLLIDDQPEAIFGVVEKDKQTGIVWMLGTDELVREPKRFWIAGKSWLTTLHMTWPVLTNYIDARNEVHIRWLERMGAKFHGTEPEFGFEKRPFRLFTHV
jgi:hypothetical protein